jgi:Beta-propeller repeat
MLIQKEIVRLFSVLSLLALMLTPVQLAHAAPLETHHVAAVPAILQFASGGNALGTYDPSFPLTVEPSLVWNTFIEFTNWGNLGNGIAVDSSGNVLVTGTSHLTWGTPVRPFGGGVQDAYVAKFSPDGALLWNTFLGGSGDDYGRGIAVDGDNILVSGTSDATWGAPVLAYKSFTDAFVAKLSPDGGLLWNTFLGSSSSNSNLGPDTGNGIAVDGSGSVLVTGSSSGTWGNPVHAFSPDPNGFASTDAFVAKLSSSGALTWNTFLGASGNAMVRTYSGNDVGLAVAVDGDNVFVSGTSGSSWGVPVRAFTYGTSSDGYAVWATMDVFVAKLNSGGALTWNTFLGSSADESGPGIAVDNSSNNVVVVGTSGAAWGSSPLRAYSGKSDAFAAQLNSSGALTWNTFLGASGFDNGNGVIIDGSGNVFVAGLSDTTWGAPLRAHTIYGSNNGFVAKLISSGALQTNTFIGGTTNTYGNGIARDASGYLYITGWSEDTWGTPLQGIGGNFVAKVDLSLFPFVVSSVRASPNPSKAASVKFTVTFSRAVTGVDKTDFSLTTNGVTGASVASVTGSGTTYTVTVNTGSGGGTLRLNVIDNDSIIDAGAIPLGGIGLGNGNFTTGQIYNIKVVQFFLPFISK